MLRNLSVREMALDAVANEIEVELKVGDAPAQLLRDLAQFGTNVKQINGSIHLQTDNETRIPELNRWLVGQGVDVFKLTTAKPSLETLFLQVMGDDARAG